MKQKRNKEIWKKGEFQEKEDGQEERKAERRKPGEL